MNCYVNVEESQLIEKSFSMYPNPAGNTVTIESPEDVDARIIMTDALGKTVMNSTFNGTTETLNTSTLKNGVYFVHTISSDGVKSKTQRLIVNK